MASFGFRCHDLTHIKGKDIETQGTTAIVEVNFAKNVRRAKHRASTHATIEPVFLRLLLPSFVPLFPFYQSTYRVTALATSAKIKVRECGTLGSAARGAFGGP